MAAEQITLPACDGFELLPVASEQMTSPVCDGAEPFPVVTKQMPPPKTPETEQEPLPVALEDVIAYGVGDLIGAVT